MKNEKEGRGQDGDSSNIKQSINPALNKSPEEPFPKQGSNARSSSNKYSSTEKPQRVMPSQQQLTRQEAQQFFEEQRRRGETTQQSSFSG